MSRKVTVGPSVAIGMTVFLATAAGAQEFPDMQTISNNVLFERRDAAVRIRDEELRRVEEIDRRSRMQASLLQQQAAFVEVLGSQLQTLRGERQLVELAASFDAMVAARQWSAVRSFLADQVTVDLVGGTPAEAAILSAEAFVERLATSRGKVSVLPRSNQQVRFEGDRAVLTSSGLPWSRSTGSRTIADERPGRYEYRYVRTGEGWKIDGPFYRP